MSSTAIKSKKLRLSYCVPPAVLNEIKEKMVSGGYDLKGKSKWISEGIEELLQMNNYCELVNLSEQMQGFQKMDSVSVDVSLKTKLDKSIVEIRKLYPTLEGVQSKIIRTAILQKLIQHM